MRKILLFVLLGVCSTMMSQQPTTLNVDAGREKGDMKPIWAWFGYDEPNYTYMKYGKKLLSEIAEMSPTVYVRAHNLMTSGDGTPALKWGSTNIYTEDVNGQPVYTWNIIDSIFDTYVRLHMRPLVEIGFMPEALSTHPQPYRHHWQPGHDYKEICTGWAYPPKDYTKWAELIYQWVKHCNQRYGKDEVEKWYWELWNEPDGDYLMVKDKVKTYCKMYDYASDAVKRALPSARIGGPHTTGGGRKFLKTFIQHCISDTNAVTGKIGAPLDFIGFHAKGRPSIVDKHVRMSIQNQLRDVYENLKIVSSFPPDQASPCHHRRI
jgi:xylan 1,4-beta-xylosidase